jgi:hypothetical protein
MADAQDTSEAARSLANARWGGTVARRAALTVIDRVADLPDDLRGQVHDATAPAGDEGDDAR